MSPLPLTMRTPFSTFHGASPPLADCHLDRSLPSKSTIASDGGLPGCCWVLSVPGVTTFGWGRFSSWTAHFLLPVAPSSAANDCDIHAANAKQIRPAHQRLTTAMPHLRREVKNGRQ